MDLINTALAALGGGTSAIVLKWLYQAWLRRTSFKSLLHQVDYVNSRLEIIDNKTGAVRAAIFVAHNGGGIPRLGNHIKTSILYEHAMPNHKRLKNGWQDVPITPEHTRMLINVATTGSAECLVEGLGNGTLKDMYEVNEIVHSQMFWIGQEKTRWYYLSVQFAEGYVCDANSRDVIREELSKLRKLFAGNYKRAGKEEIGND